jgi:chromosome segregation ATPase
MLRRLESELEAIRAQTNRISRLDDRLELVQAERTRHNERLNEIAAELANIDHRLNEHGERTSLLETRMTAYSDGQRAIEAALEREREKLASYLQGLADLESEFRRRQMAALEKEIRDLKSRALRFAEE